MLASPVWRSAHPRRALGAPIGMKAEKISEVMAEYRSSRNFSRSTLSIWNRSIYAAPRRSLVKWSVEKHPRVKWSKNTPVIRDQPTRSVDSLSERTRASQSSQVAVR